MFKKHIRKILIASFFLILAGGLFLLSTPQTTKNDPLAKFLKEHQATESIAKAYKIAYENPQNVLSKVKCYCGCIKNNGHKNNRDCFMNEDGSFDLMGLNCGLCVKTALISKQMLDEGKSVQEISDYVDAKWGKLN